MHNLFSCFARITFQKRIGQKTKIKIPLERDLDKQSDKKTEKALSSFNNNLQPITILFLNSVSRKWLFPLFAPIMYSFKYTKSPLRILELLVDQLLWSITSRFLPEPDLPKKSLRKMVVIKPPTSAEEGSQEMAPLRLGR